MLSRVLVKCGTCAGAITARIQVGHEREQPITFSCAHCGTEIRLRLMLDRPPRVKISWDDNCSAGDSEGIIHNIAAGMVISEERLRDPYYFPSFDLPKPQLTSERIAELRAIQGPDGALIIDGPIELGAFPNAEATWKEIAKAVRFAQTVQVDNENQQLDKIFGTGRKETSKTDFALAAYFSQMLEPRSKDILSPLFGELDKAFNESPAEVIRLADEFSAGWLKDRIESYVEIFNEYFKAYHEFDQTLIYARRNESLREATIATSVDFAKTKMFYGNAFELLGSLLDFPVALNNIINGRPFDQLNALTLNGYRKLKKASRTNALSTNVALSWFFEEFDSTIRNASHHRWFKLSNDKTKISYRSGGTGALQHMSYAQYLLHCNRIALQIMAMVCLDIAFVRRMGIAFKLD